VIQLAAMCRLTHESSAATAPRGRWGAPAFQRPRHARRTACATRT